MNWTDTDLCRDGHVCQLCRNKHSPFRARHLLKFLLPGNTTDFDCPFGKPWLDNATCSTSSAFSAPAAGRQPSGVSTPIAARSIPTPKQAMSALQAMLTGTKVSLAVAKTRQAICAQCNYSRLTPAGVRWCGICGCSVHREAHTVLNLSHYAENLPLWGCKHPQRAVGKGWPQGQVKPTIA